MPTGRAGPNPAKTGRPAPHLADGGKLQATYIDSQIDRRWPKMGPPTETRRPESVPQKTTSQPKLESHYVDTYTDLPPVPLPQPAPHMANGGKADGHWMEKAFKNAGKPGHSLHASLNVAAGKPIPAGKMTKALQSKDSHVQHMAQAAENAGAGRKRPRFGG